MAFPSQLLNAEDSATSQTPTWPLKPSGSAPSRSHTVATTAIGATCVVAILAAAVFAVAVSRSTKTAATAPSSTWSSNGGRLAGSVAPEFRLAPLLGSGAPVTLHAASGRPIVLSFFASWCGGCRAELATLSSTESHAGRVALIGVDVNDQARTAEALLSANHLSYPVGSDPTSRLALRYGLVGLPETLFLDSDHRVVGEVFGPLTTAESSFWLDRLQA